MSTEQHIDEFIKDCADVCTEDKINSFINNVGRESGKPIHTKYNLSFLKYNNIYLVISKSDKIKYLIKFDKLQTISYILDNCGWDVMDAFIVWMNLPKTACQYNESTVEQDGHTYKIFLTTFLNKTLYSLSVIDANTREQVFSICVDKVACMQLAFDRFSYIKNDVITIYDLPDNIKEQVISLSIINLLGDNKCMKN